VENSLRRPMGLILRNALCQSLPRQFILAGPGSWSDGHIAETVLLHQCCPCCQRQIRPQPHWPRGLRLSPAAPPAISGTYPLDALSQFKILSISAYITVNGKFPGGGGCLVVGWIRPKFRMYFQVQQCFLCGLRPLLISGGTRADHRDWRWQPSCSAYEKSPDACIAVARCCLCFCFGGARICARAIGDSTDRMRAGRRVSFGPNPQRLPKRVRSQQCRGDVDRSCAASE